MTIAVLPLLEPLVRFLLDRPPLQAGLVGLCVGWFICPVYVYLLAVFTQLRWPRYRDQFRGFMPGNLFLGVVSGAVAYLAARAVQEGSGFFADFPQTWWWVWVPVAPALALLVWMSTEDIRGAIRHKPGDTATFHWSQLLDATKVYHNVVVYTLYAWMLVALGVPGALLAPFDWAGIAARVVGGLALSAWIYMLKLDGDHPKHRTGHIRVYGAVGVLQWAAAALFVGLTVVLLREVL